MRTSWALRAAVPVLLLAAACGGAESDEADEDLPPPPDYSGSPVGSALMPDLAPVPPHDLHTKESETGSWQIRFSSVLVNVGEGDFVLDATREGDYWHVSQVIPYSTSGSEQAPVKTTLLWGGDGHGHWHAAEVATYRLIRLDEAGRPLKKDLGRTDSKIGFCFFDFHKELDRGPEEKVYSRHGCGERDDEHIRMGLSPGWNDTYEWILPGQSIEIDGLPDGTYRLEGHADVPGVFREASVDNNVTWADFELATTSDGLRTALVQELGPTPE